MADERNWYAALGNLTDELVLVHDVDRQVVFVSPSVEQVLGFTEDEFRAFTTPELIHPDDLPIAVEQSMALRDAPGASYRSTLRLRTSDGGWRWVDIVGRNLLDDPEIAGVVQTIRDVSERRDLEDRLRHQATHDALTGLANRAALVEALRDVSATGGAAAVVFLDLDRFKVVNDSLGHAAGDALLVEVAGRVASALGPHDLAARFGGDEFVVLARGAHDEDALRALGERVRAAVRGPATIAGAAVFVTPSVGVAGSRQVGDDDDLLRDADVALYEAKRRGRDRVQRFDDELRARVLRQHRDQSLLRAALDDGHLTVWFQPIVDLAAGRPVAHEALARWEHPDRGVLHPTELFAIAEEAGLSLEVGDRALRLACTAAAGWPPGTGSVHVNLGGRQLVDPSAVDRVAEALADAGLATDRLYVGVREQALVDDRADVEAVLVALRDLGAHVVLDDVGAASETVRNLGRLPIDVVKVDRDSIAGLLDDPVAAAITEAVLRIASAASVTTVAVGVETAAQRDRLLEMGCDQAQGTLLGAPTPVGPT